MKKIKKMLRMLLAIAFPWILFLIYDQPLYAFFALVMQVTAIGWPFAAFWALRHIRQNEVKPQKKKTQELSNIEDENE